MRVPLSGLITETPTLLERWTASVSHTSASDSVILDVFSYEPYRELLLAWLNVAQRISFLFRIVTLQTQYMKESGMDIAAPCWIMWGENPVVASLVELQAPKTLVRIL